MVLVYVVECTLAGVLLVPGKPADHGAGACGDVRTRLPSSLRWRLSMNYNYERIGHCLVGCHSVLRPRRS